MREKISWKGVWEILKVSAHGFIENRVLRMSSSLSYYTIFSMAPMLIIVIYVSSVFLGRETVQSEVYSFLAEFIGADSALKLQELMQSAALSESGPVTTVIGLITLLVGATSVFAEIQDSINSIWGIKPKPKRGWLKIIKNRILSFSVIISLAFILLVSLVVTAVIDGLSDTLQNKFPEVGVIVFYVVNQLITLGVISLIFSVVYKVLPDARIRWRDVFAGAMTSALLFMLGKFGVSYYISNSDFGSTYGAAASLVVLLLWTYYSSMILYFGAELTKAYALKYGSKIVPNDYAVTVKHIDVETGSASVQTSEKKEVKIATPKRTPHTKKGPEHNA